MQRFDSRLPCLLDDVDRIAYLELLGEALLVTDVKLHAYVLMDNHVYLLVTPPEWRGGRMMQMLGRNVVRQFNALHGRTGTLWEGRYKSCLIADADYFLRCARYIDLNPVRARMIDDPALCPWSSCAGLYGLRDDPLLSLHPTQRDMEATDKERGNAYRAMLQEAINDEDLAAIRTYLQQQRAYGRDDFRAMVEAKT